STPTAPRSGAPRCPPPAPRRPRPGSWTPPETSHEPPRHPSSPRSLLGAGRIGGRQHYVGPARPIGPAGPVGRQPPEEAGVLELRRPVLLLLRDLAARLHLPQPLARGRGGHVARQHRAAQLGDGADGLLPAALLRLHPGQARLPQAPVRLRGPGRCPDGALLRLRVHAAGGDQSGPRRDRRRPVPLADPERGRGHRGDVQRAQRPGQQLRVRPRAPVRLARRRDRLPTAGSRAAEALADRAAWAARAGSGEQPATKPKVDRQVVLRLLRSRSFIGFMVLMFGAAALYDAFAQQFPTYFARFVTGSLDPQVLFSRVVFAQILAEALVMVAMPFIINKIGAKRGLQLFAIVLIVRVGGSAFCTHPYLLIHRRPLAAVARPRVRCPVLNIVLGATSV